MTSTSTGTDSVTAMRQRDAKRFFLLWLRRYLICYFLIIAAFLVYVFGVQGTRIEWVGHIQRNYAKYLVSQNDVFVESMMEFEALTSKTGIEYSDSEKAQIREILAEQNEFLNKLQKRSPNESNSDYMDLYQDMLQIFAFYIQGEIMMAEYCYAYTDSHIPENEFSGDGTGLESYTMGKEMCNMMGNMILNNYRYINEIRGTNHASRFNIVEIGTN